MSEQALKVALEGCPIVAILRGITPAEAHDVALVLLEAGIRAIEVPFNSPEPLRSVEIIRKAVGDDALVGGGTVLDVRQVAALADVGAQLSVSPNVDPAVIEAAIAADLVPMPGFATATEMFTAIRAGARFLKVFPAVQIGVKGIHALKAVQPSGTHLLAVGGVNADNAGAYLHAGCFGLGTGSNLYSPGASLADVARNATELVRSLQHL